MVTPRAPRDGDRRCQRRGEQFCTQPPGAPAVKKRPAIALAIIASTGICLGSIALFLTFGADVPHIVLINNTGQPLRVSSSGRESKVPPGSAIDVKYPSTLALVITNE